MTNENMTCPPIDDFNSWADYYFYQWGLNVIPAPTVDKGKDEKDRVSSWIRGGWQHFQHRAMSSEEHEQFKRNGDYMSRWGIAIIPGKVWRGSHTGEWLVFIDCDNELAIQKICTLFGVGNLQELSRFCVVEQHTDAPNKAHIYFCSKTPFVNAPGLKGRGNKEIVEKIEQNELPAWEIKSQGDGLAYCTPSLHANGNKYRFVGAPMPELVLSEAEAADKMCQLEEIYNEFGLSYLDNGNNNNNGGNHSNSSSGGKSDSSLVPIDDMLTPEYYVQAGNNRHLDCLRIGDHFLFELEDDKVHALAETQAWNEQHCLPPLSGYEVEHRFYKYSVPFYERKMKERGTKPNRKAMSKDRAIFEEEEEGDKDDKNSKAKGALEIAQRHSKELFVNEFGRAFAAIKVDDHIEVHPMDEQRFKNWISNIYYKAKDDLLSEEDIKKVIRILQAKAEFDRNIPRHRLDVRVRGYDKKREEQFQNSAGSGTAIDNEDEEEELEDFDAIYYDLTNRRWQAVKITPEGWSIDNDPPILFRRFGSERAQVYPDRDYPPDILEQFLSLINLKNGDKESIYKQLLKGYIPSLFWPNTTPKPILMLSASHGSAKTTAFELLRDLVDPNTIKTASLPKEAFNLKQYLAHNYMSFFDNVSSISDEQSDILCRGVTGAGDMKRKLYENDEDIVYSYRRIEGLNGITNAATRPDLLDRGLIVELGEIKKQDRKLLRKIKREYKKLKPKLLAFCIDIIVEVIRERKKWRGKDDDFFGLEDTIMQNGGLPRMADWAILAEQAAAKVAEIEGRTYTSGDLLRAFDENLEVLNSEVLKESPVAEALISFMTDREVRKIGVDEEKYGDKFTHWGEATASQMLSDLETFITFNSDLKINTKKKPWPQDPSLMGREIARLAPNLRDIGIMVEKRRTEFNVFYKITKMPTAITLLAAGDKSRSNEGQNPVSINVSNRTGSLTGEQGEKHAQSDGGCEDVRNVSIMPKLEAIESSKAPLTLSHQQQQELIEKVMLDEQGNKKGYFTLLDLSFHLQMLPNEHWTEDDTKQLIDQWVKESKLQQIESDKYKPYTQKDLVPVTRRGEE